MRTRIALTLAALPLVLGAGKPAADSSLLRPFVHKGDQWTTSTEFDLELAQGGEKEKAEETSWKLQRRDRIDSEVLEAKADLATKLRRNYMRSQAKTRLKAGKAEAVEKQEDTLLNQANLVLEKDGDATKLVSGGENLGAELKSSFEVDAFTSAFLPAEKIEEGKEWTLEGKRVGGFLVQQLAAVKGQELKDASGKLKLSFKGIKEEKGKKNAEISIEGELTFTLITPKEGGSETRKLSWQPKGHLLFDPTTSRSTDFTIEGKVEENGGPAKGSAKLSIDVEDKEAPSGAAMRLLARFHPGDVTTKDDQVKIEITLDEMTMSINGKKQEMPEIPDQSIKISTKLKTSNEILEASEGKIKKLRREFQDVNFEMKGPGGQPPENPMEELEGKIIIVEEEGGEVHAKPDTGVKVDEKLIKGQTMGDEFRIFLPEDEVKKGSTWSPDEKKLVEMFQRMMPSLDDEDGEGKAGEVVKTVLKKLVGGVDCKLTSVSEEEGTTVAHISLKANVSLDINQDDFPKEMRGEGGPDVDVSVAGKFEGELLFDVKAGKPIKFGFAGPVTVRLKFSQSSPEQNMEFEQIMKASGNLDIETNYTKGKPGK